MFVKYNNAILSSAPVKSLFFLCWDGSDKERSCMTNKNFEQQLLLKASPDTNWDNWHLDIPENFSLHNITFSVLEQLWHDDD